MSEDTMKAEGGLTRREMLKKSALVGAVAWTAPIVASFNTPAFAQVTVSPASCTDWNCGDPFVICGTNPGVPAPHDKCLCDTTTEGDTFCWNDEFCNNSPECDTTGECAPGWRCVTSCCTSTKAGTCLPPCGTFVTGTENQGAATAAGN